MPEPTIELAERAIEKGTMIGAGISRDVYRLGSARWVVKKPSGGLDQNQTEWDNYQRLLALQQKGRLSPFVRLPWTFRLSNGMIVQQYVGGLQPPACGEFDYERFMPYPCRCAVRRPYWNGKCWLDIAKSITSDAHNENVKLKKEEVWVFDLGFGSRDL